MDKEMNRKLVFRVVLVIAIVVGVGLLYFQLREGPLPQEHEDQETAMDVEAEAETEEEIDSETELDQEPQEAFRLPLEAENGILLQDLTIPWELAFLPEHALLVTERPGNLVYIAADGSRHAIPIKHVEHVGEGGLLGLALHPSFEENRYLYLYLTTRSGNELVNRVERYHFANGVLTKDRIILDGIPGARNHNGGRLAFGPDEMLYITTGDAAVPALSQDRASLAGKILRLHDDGAIPADNPFQTPVYSYGHRNPQGLAWDASGALWATEHGARALDELNQILPGRNYGWPVIQGDETAPGMEQPAAHSGTGETWAPSGAAYADGSIFFTGLRGSALYEAVLADTEVVEVKSHLQGEFGRLRNVSIGPDGYLYLLTNNRDGRGSPAPGDDKLLRLPPPPFR